MLLLAVAFGLFIPVPLFAFPLAVLLLSSRMATRTEVIVATLAGALSAGWFMLPGPFSDQVLRAGLLFSTVAFVLLLRLDGLTFTHRALLSIGLATTGVIALFLIFGWNWE